MAQCPACGATVRPAITEDGEELILDTYTEPTGERRYKVLTNTPPRMLVERVQDDRPVNAYPDHRVECPGFGNGRR